jgi:hypothetical protein
MGKLLSKFSKFRKLKIVKQLKSEKIGKRSFNYCKILTYAIPMQYTNTLGIVHDFNSNRINFLSLSLS